MVINALLLSASVLLQLSAAVLALRLIRITGWRGAWTLIAIAVFLMAVRRSITLFRLLGGDLDQPLDAAAELVALGISILMAAGLACVGPVFESIRLAERRRHMGEAQFRGMIDASLLGVFIHVNYRLVYANQAFSDLLGYDNPEQLLAVGDVGILRAPEDRERLKNYYDARSAGNPAPARYEYKAQRKDGSEIWLENFVQLVQWQGRQAVMATAIDVSDRKQAEEGLVRFKTTLDLTADCVFMFSPETLRFIYVNEGAIKQVGYSEAEMLTMSPLDIKPEFDEESFREMIAPLISGQAASHMFETQHRSKEGVHIPVEVFLQYIAPEDETPRFVAIVRDISERRQALEELRQSEERFRAIAHAVPYPIAVVAIDSGQFLYANQSCMEIFALEDHDLADIRAEDFYVNISDRQHLVDTVKREGRIESFEREMKKRTGEHFWAVSSSVEMEYEGVHCVITGLVDITDQKKAAEELRAGQRLLRTIFDTVPNWLYTKDSEGRYQTVNRSMADFFNLQPEDFIGKNIQEIITHKDGAEAAVRSDHEVVERNVAVNLPEARVTAPDGKVHIRHIVKLPLRDDAGDAIGIVGASEDVTERKATEQALRESEARLSDAIESIPDGLALFDAEDRLVLTNSNFSKTFPAHSEVFVPGSSFADMLREVVRRGGFAEAVGREEEWIAERLEQHTNPKGPFEQKLADGRWLRIEERRTSQGGIVGLRTDITELKQIEQALRTSEERFRATLDNSPSAVTLKGLDGRFQLSNRRFNTLFGFSAQEVVGKTSHDLFSKEIADRIEALDREVLETGKVIESEQERILPNGEKYIALIGKFPVTGSDGELHGVGTISTDISAQKRFEQQLRESQKMEAVGQLAGGIAHDFNNMLQVIINRALFAKELLEISDGMNEHLDAIVEAGEHAADLTRQLLAFSRRSVMKSAPLNLNDLTANLMRMVGRIFGEQIELEFKPGPNLHYVNADPGMVEQVILNLCVNARDAMPEGGRIQIETRNFHADTAYCTPRGWDNPGDYVMMTVRDSGTGMTPEIKERIFEPFFTSKKVGEGTGLGLAMVYGIVRQHEGQMEVESAPGAGSTFKMLLPAVGELDQKEESETVDDLPRGSETILVVEDQPSVREIISRMLSSKGYHVLTACDGEEAVLVFKDHANEISLVLLDMVLPKLSGREALEQIRGIRADAAVLFSTGYSPDTVDKEFLGGNGLRLIQKPYAPTELLKTVREVIDQPQRISPAARP